MKTVRLWVGIFSPVLFLAACLEMGALTVSKSPSSPKTGQSTLDALLTPPAGGASVGSTASSPNAANSSSPIPDASSSSSAPPIGLEGDSEEVSGQTNSDDLLETCIVGRWPGIPQSCSFSTTHSDARE